jgi:hypothetical protein
MPKEGNILPGRLEVKASRKPLTMAQWHTDDSNNSKHGMNLLTPAVFFYSCSYNHLPAATRGLKA